MMWSHVSSIIQADDLRRVRAVTHQNRTFCYLSIPIEVEERRMDNWEEGILETENSLPIGMLLSNKPKDSLVLPGENASQTS